MGTKHGRVAELLCPQLSAAESLAHGGASPACLFKGSKKQRSVRSSLCGGDWQVTVEKSCPGKTAWTVSSVMLWFFALRASLNWGPPCDGLSMCLPCVPSLEGISQDGRYFLGNTEV